MRRTSSLHAYPAMSRRAYVTRPAVIPERVTSVQPGSSGSLSFSSYDFLKTPEQAELEQLRKEKVRLERQNAAMARKLKQTEARGRRARGRSPGGSMP